MQSREATQTGSAVLLESSWNVALVFGARPLRHPSSVLPHLPPAVKPVSCLPPQVPAV